MNNLGHILDAKDVVTLEYLQGRYAGGDGTNPYLNLAYLNDNLRGRNGGIAPLDDNGKVPMSNIPDTILGQVVFGGTVNFANNTLTATIREELKRKLGTTASTIVIKNSATGDYGYQQLDAVFFLAGNAFEFAGMTFDVGDWLISIGTAWKKIDNTDAVTSVNGKIGAVTLTLTDIMGNTKIADSFIASATTWNAKYDKPSGGIPETDLASDVQTLLGLANTAFQLGVDLDGRVKTLESRPVVPDGVLTISNYAGTLDNAYVKKTAVTGGGSTWGSSIIVDGKTLSIPSKPTYAFGDLTAHPTTLSGYGIADAKIADGVITLGSNTITPWHTGNFTPSDKQDVNKIQTTITNSTTNYPSSSAVINYVAANAPTKTGEGATGNWDIISKNIAELGATVVNETFAEKTLTEVNEVAEVTELRGNTIAWNQLANPIQVEIGAGAWNTTVTTNKMVLGHKILAIHKFLEGSGTEVYTAGTGIDHYLLTFVASSGQVVTNIFTASSTDYQLKRWANNHTKKTPVEIQLHDLTQMGIADLVNSVDDFYRLVPAARNPMAYNEGQLVNFTADALVSKGGVNLWDEEWEVGAIESTGAFNSSATTRRTTSFIKVASGKTYFFSLPSSAQNGRCAIYDANKQMIAFNVPAILSGQAYAMPSNAAYVRVTFGVNYGTTYNHDICINISDPAINGKYFPYEKVTRKVNVTELRSKSGEVIFPDGMKKAGSAYDEIRGKKAIKRIRVKVFDGTENWEASSLFGSVRRYNLQSFLVPSHNLITNRYSKIVVGTPNVEGFEIHGELNYLIIQSSITDLAAWKSHLAELYAAGTPLVVEYELATPIEYDLEDDVEVILPAMHGSTISLEKDGMDASERAKYGVVDLGDLEWWSVSTKTGVFRANKLPNQMSFVSPAHINDLICDRYPSTGYGDIWNLVVNKGVTIYDERDELLIRDASFTDAASFKAAVKGVKLYYELAAGATPVTAPLNATMAYFKNGRDAIRKSLNTEAFTVKTYGNQTIFGNKIFGNDVEVKGAITCATTGTFSGKVTAGSLQIGSVTISTDTDGNLKIDGNAYATGFLSAGGINPERQSRGFVTETFTTTAGVWKEINNATGSTNVCVSLYKGNALVYAEVEVTTTKIKVKTEQSQTLKAVIVSID